MSVIRFNSKFYLYRKRDASEDAFEPLFETASQLDSDDCAKLMVCHVFEKPANQVPKIKM